MPSLSIQTPKRRRPSSLMTWTSLLVLITLQLTRVVADKLTTLGCKITTSDRMCAIKTNVVHVHQPSPKSQNVGNQTLGVSSSPNAAWALWATKQHAQHGPEAAMLYWATHARGKNRCREGIMPFISRYCRPHLAILGFFLTQKNYDRWIGFFAATTICSRLLFYLIFPCLLLFSEMHFFKNT